ncbi:hypothetical protein BKA93DRAFT_210486 [Sparassis latifolia]
MGPTAHRPGCVSSVPRVALSWDTGTAWDSKLRGTAVRCLYISSTRPGRGMEERSALLCSREYLSSSSAGSSRASLAVCFARSSARAPYFGLREPLEICCPRALGSLLGVRIDQFCTRPGVQGMGSPYASRLCIVYCVSCVPALLRDVPLSRGGYRNACAGSGLISGRASGCTSSSLYRLLGGSHDRCGVSRALCTVSDDVTI